MVDGNRIQHRDYSRKPATDPAKILREILQVFVKNESFYFYTIAPKIEF